MFCFPAPAVAAFYQTTRADNDVDFSEATPSRYSSGCGQSGHKKKGVFGVPSRAGCRTLNDAIWRLSEDHHLALVGIRIQVTLESVLIPALLPGG